MFIRNPEKIDLGTIDLAIQTCNIILEKLSLLNITQNDLVNEVDESKQHLLEIRLNYEDGATTAKSHRDICIMLTHVNLVDKVMQLLSELK